MKFFTASTSSQARAIKNSTIVCKFGDASATRTTTNIHWTATSPRNKAGHFGRRNNFCLGLVGSWMSGNFLDHSCPKHTLHEGPKVRGCLARSFQAQTVLHHGEVDFSVHRWWGKIPKLHWFYDAFLASSRTNPRQSFVPNKQTIVAFCVAICSYFLIWPPSLRKCANWNDMAGVATTLKTINRNFHFTFLFVSMVRCLLKFVPSTFFIPPLSALHSRRNKPL